MNQASTYRLGELVFSYISSEIGIGCREENGWYSKGCAIKRTNIVSGVSGTGTDNWMMNHIVKNNGCFDGEGVVDNDDVLVTFSTSCFKIEGNLTGGTSGLPNCDEIGHMMEEGHCVRTVHAEHNAILQSAKLSGASTDGATLYLKYIPCIHCSKYIVAAGVKRVVYVEDYRASIAVSYLKEAGIDVDKYNENKKWNEKLVDLFSHEVKLMKPKEGDVKIKK